jgi:carboxypeptidase Q
MYVAMVGWDFDNYDVRTRHTNADFSDRVTEDELKRSAIVLATFAWHAAQRNEKIPPRAPRAR